MSDGEATPHARRLTDAPTGNLELILYQLGELKSDVREGFARVEANFDGMDRRMKALENFRERVEERERQAARAEGNTNNRVIPIALAGLGFVGILLGAILSSHAL